VPYSTRRCPSSSRSTLTASSLGNTLAPIELQGKTARFERIGFALGALFITFTWWRP
jgi:hypothetical protein